jgi:putative transposase
LYHKITSYYSNNNSTIVLEELKIKEMTKKGSKKTKLNSLIRSSAWKLLENQFKYKLNWYQKNGKLILIKPYNTSRICFKCKYCEKTNRKEDVFKCLKCGHEDHADINAAKNILFFGTK